MFQQFLAVFNIWYQNVILQEPQRRTVIVASTCDMLMLHMWRCGRSFWYMASYERVYGHAVVP